MDIHFPSVPATFHHIPRTGGTSFTDWVTANIADYQIADRPWSVENEFSPPDYNWAVTAWPTLGTRIAFVRNPYSRLVSLYHYIGQLAEHRLQHYKYCLSNKIELIDWKTQPYQSDNIVACILDDTKVVELYRNGFTNWLNIICDNPAELYTSTRRNSWHLLYHFWEKKTQVSWFCGHIPDIVIKTENLDTEFSKIQDILGCSAPLPHVNNSVHSDYRDHYNDQSISLVQKHFEEDLSAFNYKF
jgi:hypothetical protein